jgi:hypothetical protein
LTVITHARRKSNLATMIDSAGGVSVGAALAQARANIEAMREQAMHIVDAAIGALEAVPAPAGPEDLPARRDEAYRAATTLIDAAGPFELFDLCRAASGLCDLIGQTTAAKHGAVVEGFGRAGFVILARAVARHRAAAGAGAIALAAAEF